MKAYLFNVLIGFDHFCNTLIGGSSDMTISASAAYARSNGKAWGCVLCRVLDWISTGHCGIAIKTDMQRIEAAEGIIEPAPKTRKQRTKPQA